MIFCKDCKKELKPSIGKQTRKYKVTGYCKPCVQKHKAKELPKFNKTCLVCNTDFIAKRKIKKFCSSKCASHRNSIYFKTCNAVHPLLVSNFNRVGKGKVRPCSYCRKEIYVMPSRTKTQNSYCSMEHQILYLKKQARSMTIPCEVCQKEIPVTLSIMKYRPRRTCSKTCLNIWKRVQAETRREKEGYTKHQLDRLARYSPEATIWRKAIFERDNYTCQFCLQRGNLLEADHIKPWAYFPDLRFDLANGRTLCRPCHNTTKTSAKKMKETWGWIETENLKYRGQKLEEHILVGMAEKINPLLIK